MPITGEKKSTGRRQDNECISSMYLHTFIDILRLGVKRTKPSLAKLTKTSSSIASPPKAAIATAKPKKEEVQRHRNAFNDMLHHRTSKENDRKKESTSNTAPVKGKTVQVEDADADQVRDGMSGEDMADTRAVDRIAELERALSVAREEQSVMREELAKLREHGLVYRETIEDHRRQLASAYNHPQSPPGAFHSRSRPTSAGSVTTPMDYEQETSPRRFSNNYRREDPSEQNHDLRSRVAQLQDQLVSQEVHFQARMDQMRSHDEAGWNELTSRLHATEKESQERLQQLLSLKSSISSLTRMDTQTTDGELTETLAQLANRVREWVVSNFRRTKFDLSAVPPETAKALAAILPNYRKVDASNRLALYQALISSSMMHIFRESIVVGLPETGPLSSIRQLAAYMHGAGADFQEWRRTTVRSLGKSDAQKILQQERERLTHRLCSEIIHQLFTLTSVNLTPAAQTTLESILQGAVALQNTLLLQKAQYRILFYRNEEGHEIAFDDQKMEVINDIDSSSEDDMVVERKFSFCVFPCLEKSGDEYGEHANVRNVLLKASVCCHAG